MKQRVHARSLKRTAWRCRPWTIRMDWKSGWTETKGDAQRLWDQLSSVDKTKLCKFRDFLHVLPESHSTPEQRKAAYERIYGDTT